MSEIRTRFLRAMADHKLTIEHDDGVFRTLLFKVPGTFNLHFRLTTWPGHLAISGDCGDYMFSRAQDMFKFFRCSEDGASAELSINPRYWSEKCVATDRRGGLTEYDEDAFKEYVVRTLRDYHFDAPGARLSAFRQAREELLESGIDDDPIEATRAAMGFCVRDGAHGLVYPFADAWDCSFTNPSFRLCWCLWCIVWGIKRYDQYKAGRTQQDRDRAVLAPTQAQVACTGGV